MRRTILAVCAVLGALCAMTSAHAQRVDNFTLLDQNGASHELYYRSDKAAIVIMVQGNGCPIVRNAWPAFRAIREQYAARNVEFLMLNSNLQDDRAAIAAEAREFGYDAPILVDETQLVGEALGVIRTSEVFVIDTKGWKLAYRGPIDDRLTYERQKPEATEHYLRAALDAVLSGKSVEVAERDAVGCIVNFPNREKRASISYSETVAPLLLDKCAGCHRPGGIAPWAMTSHRMVLGFAPTIREVLRTRRMPPWHADPHVGEWLSDRGLSAEETATIVHWVEAGAPRGDGPDPLEAVAAAASDWGPLGEPDLVVTLPAFNVPATGVVNYQFPFVANPLDKPVWVRAAAVAAGARAVVHHVLAGYSENAVAAGPGARAAADNNIFENYLIGYAPGVEGYEFPKDTGVLVAPGGSFVFQMHYTPNGRAVTDVTRLGLYFYDEPPAGILRHSVAMNPQLAIPPQTAAHTETAYLPFPKDAILYTLFPHAHYRGRSSKFEIEYPDGRTELLLSVPKYDFNWQREYNFVEPLAVPAGSKLIHTTVYDNSAQNKGNPDPARRVRWGQQSWDEMLYGAVRFRWTGETSSAPTHDVRAARVGQLYGYLDTNRDSALTTAELPIALRLWITPRFATLDKNANGLLEMTELLEVAPLLQ